MDLLPVMFALFFNIFEMYNDAQFIIKIFVFVAMVSFVKNHVGGKTIGMLVMAGIFVFIFGDLWRLFGTLYILYMLLIFGIAGIIIDFFFVGGMTGQKQQTPEGMMSAPLSSGADVARRGAQMQMAKQAANRPRMGR